MTSSSRWPTRRLKTIADVRVSNVDKKSADGETSVRLCNYTDVYCKEQITNDLGFMTATAPESQIRRFRLRPGDVLITKDSESWDDIAVPAVVAESVDAVCGYHLAQLRPRPDALDGRYLFYALKSPGPVAHFKVRANGVTRYAIGTTAIGDAPVPLPPLPAQRALVSYLDSETSRIDSLIDRKERFIELLLEKRTALITHAVTKGLDSDVEMKDSGIEWFGGVPKHWAVLRLKDLVASIQTGPFGTQLGSDDYVEAGVPVINPAHIVEDSLAPQEGVTVDEETAVRLSHYRLAEGDVICARRGQLGRCAVVTPVATGWVTGTGSLRVRPDRRKVEPAFLQLLVSQQGSKDWLQLQSVGSTMDNLNEGILSRLPVAAPSVDEQAAILGHMQAEVSKVDQLIDKTRKSSELLKEYRTALISAAVTGQIEIPATDSGEDVA